MNRDHSVVFETASKYCISDSFLDYDGYSISSKGFLPTVVDIMVIWVKFTFPVHFTSLIPKMSMFTLPISCLTISNLLWFMDPQVVKRLSTVWETWVRSLGWEVPWRRKWQPSPILLPRKAHGWRSLVSIGSQRVGHNWETSLHMDLTSQVPMQCCPLQHWILLPSPVTSTTGCYFCFNSVSSFFLELFLHWSSVAYWAPTDLGSSSFSVISFCLFIHLWGSQGKNTEVFAIPLSSGPDFVRTLHHDSSVLGGPTGNGS